MLVIAAYQTVGVLRAIIIRAERSLASNLDTIGKLAVSFTGWKPAYRRLSKIES
jgi:hypothetical protein